MRGRDLGGPDEKHEAVSKNTVRDVDVTKKNTVQSDCYRPKGDIPDSREQDDEDDEDEHEHDIE